MDTEECPDRLRSIQVGLFAFPRSANRNARLNNVFVCNDNVTANGAPQRASGCKESAWKLIIFMNWKPSNWAAELNGSRLGFPAR